MQCRRCKPEEWHKLWLDFPGAWTLLVKRFAQRLHESCWSSQDGNIAGDGQLVHLTSDVDGVPSCTDCGKQFASNCGLAVHMARVHEVRRSAPSYAGRDGICSSCKRGFHTRLRLVHHLSYSSPQCLEWCMLHCEPMTHQDREVLDRKDAGQRRKDKTRGPKVSLPPKCPLFWEADYSCCLSHLRIFFVLWAVACCFSSVQSFASFTVVCFIGTDSVSCRSQVKSSL